MSAYNPKLGIDILSANAENLFNGDNPDTDILEILYLSLYLCFCNLNYSKT